ncbi:hypothetical protein Cthiooxydans_15340 [Comamonas thiooxydans]|nr:hypothetical protein Cthiooxydans_15340 [Comamonas thiooxydans]
MLKDLFDRFSASLSYKVNETLSDVHLTFVLNKIIEDFPENLFSALKARPERDRFRLSFIGADEKTWNSTDVVFGDEVASLIVESLEEDGDTCRFELSITKDVAHEKLSVYFLKELDSYFGKTDYLEILQSLNRKFNGAINFEVFEETERFGSKTIVFSQINQAPIFQNFHGRAEVKNGFRENCSPVDFENIAGNLLPSDFFMETKCIYSNIESFFRSACGVLSMVFIANSSRIDSNLSLDYKLLGYKSVVGKSVDRNFWTDKVNNIFKIYDWAYQGGSSSDKLGLIRNLVSIHVSDDGSPKIDSVLWDAINSNYQIYLRDNIRAYIDVKAKVAESIEASTEKLSKMLEEYLSSIKNNAAIVVTFMVTVVLVNGIKDNGLETIFSSTYLWVVFILIAISFIYLTFLEKDLVKRFDRAKTILKDNVNLTYADILIKNELEKTLNSIAEKDDEYLQEQLRYYRLMSFVCLFIFGLLFAVGNFLLT